MKKHLIVVELSKLLKNIKMFLVIAVISFLGSFLVSGLSTVNTSILPTIDEFYEDNNLADYTVSVTSSSIFFPNDTLQSFSDYSEIDWIQPFNSYEQGNVTVYSYSGETENFGSIPMINEPRIIEGRMPMSSLETVIDFSFSERHGYAIDDNIMLDDEVRRIVGTAFFPQALYTGGKIPDSGSHGVAFIVENNTGPFNGLFIMSQAPKSRIDEITHEVFKDLLPNSAYYLIASDETEGYIRMNTDLELITTLTVLPEITVIIALVFIIAINSIKIADRSRKETGILKTLGYKTTTLIVYQSVIPTLIVFFSSLIGSLAGYVFLPNIYVSALRNFYSFPDLIVENAPLIILLPPLLLGLISLSLFAVFMGLMATKPPAQLMKTIPVKPLQGVRIFKRVKLAVRFKLILRNIMCYKRKLVMMVLSTSLTMSLFVFALYIGDSIAFSGDNLEVIHHDNKVAIEAPIELYDQYEEILSADPTVENFVTTYKSTFTHHGTVANRMIIFDQPNDLILKDEKGKAMTVDEDMTYFSSAFKNRYKMKVGDEIAVNLLMGSTTLTADSCFFAPYSEVSLIVSLKTLQKNLQFEVSEFPYYNLEKCQINLAFNDGKSSTKQKLDRLLKNIKTEIHSGTESFNTRYRPEYLIDGLVTYEQVKAINNKLSEGLNASFEKISTLSSIDLGTYGTLYIYDETNPFLDVYDDEGNALPLSLLTTGAVVYRGFPKRLLSEGSDGLQYLNIPLTDDRGQAFEITVPVIGYSASPTHPLLVSRGFMNSLIASLKAEESSNSVLIRQLEASLSRLLYAGCDIKAGFTTDDVSAQIDKIFSSNLFSNVYPCPLNQSNYRHYLSLSYNDKDMQKSALEPFSDHLGLETGLTIKIATLSLPLSVSYNPQPVKKLTDGDGNRIARLDTGTIYLKKNLSLNLKYAEGDFLTVKIRGHDYRFKVAYSQEYSHLALESLKENEAVYKYYENRLLKSNTVYVDEDQLPHIQEALEESTLIASSYKESIKGKTAKSEAFVTMNKYVDITRYILFVICGFIMLALIYNVGVISLSERMNDIKIMKANGMKRRKLNSINSSENILIALIGGIFALPIGYLLSHQLLKRVLNIVMIKMVPIVSPFSILTIFLGIVAITVLGNLLINNRVNKTDLATLIKEE